MTSMESIGVNLWFYSPSLLVGLRHGLARSLIYIDRQDRQDEPDGFPSPLSCSSMDRVNGDIDRQFHQSVSVSLRGSSCPFVDIFFPWLVGLRPR